MDTQKVYSVSPPMFPRRIKYCDQEIVIFREDLMSRLLRNCIISPTGDIRIEKHLVRTIIEGAHLCPLPLTTRQVAWAYDHALRIYPIPDAVSRNRVRKSDLKECQWR